MNNTALNIQNANSPMSEKEFEQKETIFFSSNKCSFIPIILSIHLKNRLLSVEHIHPPTEYFFGSRKQELVKFTKTQWVN